MTGPTLAWHWMPSDRLLRYPPHTLVAPGATLAHKGPLSLCQGGLHACPKAIDSLRYVYGPVLSRVELSGKIVGPDGEGKVCARKRTHLWMVEGAAVTRALDEWFYWVTKKFLTSRKDRGLEVLDQEWAALKAIAAWRDGTGTPEGMGRAAWDARAARDARAAFVARAARAAWATRDARDAFVEESNDELERKLLALAPVAVAS